MADMTKPVASMTVAELKTLIREVIHEEQSQELVGRRQGLRGEELKAFVDEMYKRRFVIPPGGKTSLELLREDRDR